MISVRTSILVVFVLGLTLASAQAVDPALFQEFVKWLGDNKVQSRANIKYFENQGFGGVASAPINEGDAIVQIPKSLLIAPEVYLQAPINQYNDFKLNYEPLMLWILSEKINPNSFWKPYLQILPTNFETHPYYWTEEQLFLTNGTGLYDNVISRRHFLREAFKLLEENWISKNSFFPAGYFTLDKYEWAFLTVLTRAWTIDNQLFLAPLADLLNHDPTAAPAGFVEVNGQQFFQINATHAYEPKAQVFDSYGPRSNYELLRGYGFALENNPHDYVQLHFNLKDNNLVQSIVEPILKQVDPNYNVINVFPNRRPDALLRVFRLTEMEFKDLDLLKQALEGKPISLANELRAYRSAISALASSLQRYSSTVEQDTELLKSENLSVIEKNAIIFRRSEKAIIQNIILVIGKLWENILLEGKLPHGVPVV